MILCVSHSHISGEIYIPPSKSHTMRALLFAAFSVGKSIITDPLISDDTISAVKCLGILGVKITKKRINGQIAYEVNPPQLGLPAWLFSNTTRTNMLNVGNSGSLLYFLGMLLSAFPGSYTLTGDASIAKRPITPLLELYRQGNVSYRLENPDSPTTPLHISGGLRSGVFFTEGKFSQAVSGLLMTAPLLTGSTVITLTHPQEFSYIKMTVAWLTSLGMTVTVQHHGKSVNITVAGNAAYTGFSRTIPGDWSSAIFPILAAAATKSSILLHNLDTHDSQGDKAVLNILKKMNLPFKVQTEKKTLHIFPAQKLLPITADCAHIPDAVPALAALACLAHGTTYLHNVGMCRFKECDRLEAVKTELEKMGGHVSITEDTLIITGKGIESLHHAAVDSRNDHRIGLMLASLSLGIKKNGCTKISGSDCFNVSYPEYIHSLSACGAQFQAQ